MARRQVLIGTAADFCDAFYHVKDTPEAGVTQCCLRAQTGHVCSGKTTCLIARLSSADGLEQFVRLYRNMAQTSCAEGFLLRDEALMAAVESCGGRTRNGSSNGSTLSLYLTQQPCHFSSSNDDSSCTENLLRWWRDFLEPRGVAHLRIRAAYPYRTHWDEQHMSEDDLASLGRRKWGGGKGGGGKGGKGGGGGGGSAPKFLIKEAGSAEPVAVAIHPSSVNAKETRFESKFLVFAEKVRTTQVYVRDASPVSPYALMLFGGGLVAERGGGPTSRGGGNGGAEPSTVLVVDSWIKFRVPKRVEALILDVRSKLSSLLQQKIASPNLELSNAGKGILGAVTALLGAPPPEL